jgi:hypothetical protein
MTMIPRSTSFLIVSFSTMARILDHLQSRGHEPARFLSGVEGSDRFFRFAQTGIIPCTNHLRQDGDDGFPDAFQNQAVLKGLLDHVTHLSLGFRYRHSEGDFIGFPQGFLDSDENVADLWTVAVGQDDPVTHLDQLDDVKDGRTGIGELFVYRPPLPCFDQGVPSQGHDDLCAGIQGFMLRDNP